MTPTLFRNGRVYSPADPRATALLVADGTITWLGADADAPAAGTVVDLDGGLVTPAFVDAHVHATDTGIALSGLDLSATRSAREVLDAVAAHCASLPPDAVVAGHGWDESGWADKVPPTAAQLDRAADGRMVYLSQASIHSAVASTALLAAASPAVTTAPGYDATGWLRRDAHHAVRGIAMGSITTAQRRDAQVVALRTAASYGIAAVHECGGPGTSSEDDFTHVLSLGGAAHGLPEVYGYWGELMGAAKARELGALGAGGDLYADGALGARTAHVSDAYLDGDEGACGHAYVTAEQVRDHLVDCARHDAQGGFHAIGDAAIATVLAGFAAAARVVGRDRLRAGRHRVEHAEIMNRELIRGFVEYGIVASMQPAFDRLWGGDDQMYALRLGVDRSLASNPIGAMAGVGVALAFGSDSPVTPLDPWGTVRAAMCHHNPVQRISARAAFAAHTRGGWRAAHLDGEGILQPGAPATFAVWDAPALTKGLPTLVADNPDEPHPALPSCWRTVLRGVTIFDENEL
ncbi:amidohydrolase [Luedemannella helvata]|uniref:Amidohydrolase n=1 Tax=Luedemannella helvata TaxID=349315 RepID=A0ABP4WCA2_9ACTN